MKITKHIFKKCLKINGKDRKMKEDRRTHYTKMIIRESLMELLNGKPLDKITVKELCTKADINRATFYRYYSDIFNLFKTLEEEMISQQTVALRTAMNSIQFDVPELTEQFLCITKLLKENLSFYKVFFKTRLESESLKKVIQNAHDIEYEKLENQFGSDYDFTTFEYSFEYCKQGTLGLIGKWLAADCPESPEVITNIVVNLMRHCSDDNNKSFISAMNITVPYKE